MDKNYQAILIVSFGGPEKNEDVIPFLENVLRGKPVPRERMLEVAEHYYHFDGKSPINDQVREFIAALEPALKAADIDVPIYWGNRNWHPMLNDTMQQMKEDGIEKALAFFTSGYSCYSGCRQYRENVAAAREQVGENAPVVDKIRVFYNHPAFIEANADRVKAAIDQLPPAAEGHFHIAYTAHSIPDSMANTSDYVKQLSETSRLLSEHLGIPEERWKLVYQSRSGRPQDPWLEPDIVDHMKDLKSRGVDHAIIAPIGFLSDHMEVMFDLDHEAKDECEEIGLNMVRAGTVGTHPKFIGMVVELIQERMGLIDTKQAIGHFGPNHDVCPKDCCLPPARPGRPAAATSAS